MAIFKKKTKFIIIGTVALVLCAVLALGWYIPMDAIDDGAAQYKSVILLIGDGMGENTLGATLDADDTPLIMETMTVRGQSQTNTWPGFKTADSAAGGTALASGIRVINGALGIYPFDPLGWFGHPANLSELALSMGKAAGVVTTDLTSGATPSAFSAHAANRGMESVISESQLNSGINLIWGGASKSVTEERAAENGYTYIADKDAFDALGSEIKSFAQFVNDDLKYTKNTDKTPTLEEMTAKAIDILDDDPDGFFLMVEAAHIDKFAHDNDFPWTIHHTRELDKAVAVALDYARENPDVLVIVTADHETGGIMPTSEGFVFTSGNHTNADVPVFVNRADAGFTNGGVWLSRQIGAQLGRVLGAGKKVFPTPVWGKAQASEDLEALP
ncbi:MAG: alkaline phosphatase [Oscillospiraceae bacterium]|nr:alkaline phosphatase [Oscillospiraceae bacterium]